MYIGLVTYEDQSKTHLHPSFSNFLDVSKKLIYHDDLHFKYIDFSKYQPYEKLKDLNPISSEHPFTIIMFRNNNLMDRKYYNATKDHGVEIDNK